MEDLAMKPAATIGDTALIERLSLARSTIAGDIDRLQLQLEGFDLALAAIREVLAPVKRAAIATEDGRKGRRARESAGSAKKPHAAPASGAAKRPKPREDAPVVRPGSVQDRVWQAYQQLRVAGAVSMAALAARLAMAEKNVSSNLYQLRKKGLSITIAPNAASGAASELARTAAKAPAAKPAGGQRKVRAEPEPAVPRRESDQEMIARHLREKGATKCPPAYAAPVEGAVPVSPLPHHEPANWKEQHDAQKKRRGVRVVTS